MSDSENQSGSQSGGGLSNDAKAAMAFATESKSPAIAYLLWFFLGGFGIHRFYLGRVGSGIAMLVLLVASIILSVAVIGALGYIALVIWWIVDAFLIPGMARDFNQALMQRIEEGARS